MKLLNKMKLSKKQQIIACVAVGIISFGGFTNYVSIKQDKEYQKKMESLVDIYTVAGKEKIFMTGKVEPINFENIYLSADKGELHKINVEDKQYVEKGSVLLTYKDNSKAEEIKDINLQISQKKKEKESSQDEEMKKVLDEEIKQLSKQISDLNKSVYQYVYAPFNGKVYLNTDSDKNDATKSIMKIQSSDFYVKAQVNERDSYKIEKNQNIKITTLATKEQHNGIISNISDIPLESDELSQGYSNDSGMSQYEVKVKLESQNNLKSGLHVQLTALHGDNNIKVPNSSVINENGKYYVYKVKNKIAYKTEIKVIDEKEGYTIASSGLRERDEIIRDVQGRTIEDGKEIYTGEDM